MTSKTLNDRLASYARRLDQTGLTAVMSAPPIVPAHLALMVEPIIDRQRKA